MTDSGNGHDRPFDDDALRELEFAEDRCHVCGRMLGYGIRLLHVGLCEDCRDTSREDTPPE